jgi:hypothetical protein
MMVGGHRYEVRWGSCVTVLISSHRELLLSKAGAKR